MKLPITSKWDGQTYYVDADGVPVGKEDAIAALNEMGEALAAKQAQIDWLMLEYCPDEMTAAQIEEWGKHQVPVDQETSSVIDAAAGIKRG